MADPLDLPLKTIAEKPTHDLTVSLVYNIWGIERSKVSKSSGIYLQHYSQCIAAIDQTLLSPQSHRDIVDVVAFVKQYRHETLRALKAKMFSATPSLNILKEKSEAAAHAAIYLGMRLWLMTGSVDWPEGDALSKHISDQFQKHHLSLSGQLSLTARALHQIGGIGVLWTDRLEDHLQYDRLSSRVFLFRHASFLKDLSAGDIFPPQFLTETSTTIALLFPATEVSKQRWDRRVRKRADIDVEEGLALHVSRDISAYPYWGQKLQKLQQALDTSKPRKLRQLMHDRRDGTQQATFWLAVAAVVLSLLFGLIQSITGIIQVAKSG